MQNWNGMFVSHAFVRFSPLKIDRGIRLNSSIEWK